MIKSVDMHLTVGPDRRLSVPVLLPGAKPGDQFDMYEDQANGTIMLKAVKPLGYDNILEKIIQTTWNEITEPIACPGKTLNQEFNLCLISQDRIIVNKGFMPETKNQGTLWYRGLTMSTNSVVIHGGNTAQIICPIVLKYTTERPPRTRAVLALQLPEQYLTDNMPAIMRLAANILRDHMQDKLDKEM